MGREEMETSTKTLEEFCCKRKKRNRLVPSGELKSRGLLLFGFIFTFR
jgi:hypothetical protein